jgi:hypothetical protein
MATNTPRIPKEVLIKNKKGEFISWTPARIKEQIIEKDEAVKAALLRIYSYQTQDEQQSESTRESNGKGFNGTDAEILTSFAKQLETRKFLSPKQMVIARKKLQKYSRQLFMYIVENSYQAAAPKFGL